MAIAYGSQDGCRVDISETTLILMNVRLDEIIVGIREEIERRLLTQAELARLAGVSPQRVYAVLHGRSKSLKTIRALRDALERS